MPRLGLPGVNSRPATGASLLEQDKALPAISVNGMY